MPDRTPTLLPLVFDEPRSARKPPLHLADLTADERRLTVEKAGLPGFRAKQVSHHYFDRLVDDPAEMTDLPLGLRGPLRDALLPTLVTPVRTLHADHGTTRKTLWQLHDAAMVESVLMRYPGRVTMCVSSQAGCGMACPFCATGQGGLQRNLSTAEIVEQVVAGARALARGEVPGGPGRISNVVFMGMGEPMANYNAVIGSIRRMVDPAPDGLAMSARGITVSTVGLVPRMRQLAGEGIPVTLALSLHAPDDALRSELMPVNDRYPLADVLDACRRWHEVRKRKVYLEYLMLEGVNDSPEQAVALAALLEPRGAFKVNLIPYNPTDSGFEGSGREAIATFREALEKRGVPATVRLTRGRDIHAACGQLAASAKAGSSDGPAGPAASDRRRGAAATA